MQMHTQMNQYVSNFLSKLLKSWTYCKRFYHFKTASVHTAPIVILGHAKSGTTAIAKLLGSISGQEVTIDPLYKIDPKGNLDESLFNKEITLSNLINSHKFYFSTPILKDPKLTFFYEELYRYYPEAKFIFVIRDPRDTIRSFLNRRNIPGKLDDLPLSMEDEVGGIARLPLVAGGNYIERLANRWNFSTKIYLNHKDRLFLIRYEDFVLDKIETINSLARQIGLKPINNINEYINVQYQPKGNHSISWVEFFGVANLHSIESICSEYIKYFGYK